MVWKGCCDELWCDECCVRDRADADVDADAEAAQRVPSEKQEPHTVIWGKMRRSRRIASFLTLSTAKLKKTR